MKKKILFITSTINFYETFFFETIKNLSKDNEIYIVSNLENKRKENPNVKLINLNIRRNYNIIYDIISTYNLFKIINKINPSLILSSTPKGGFICSVVNIFFSIKRVHFLTGILWSNTRGLKKKLFSFLDRIILFKTICVFVDSQSQIDLLTKNKFNHNFKLIGNGSIKGVDTNIFKKNLSTKLRLNNEHNLGSRFLILFIGRLSYEKGLYDFINIINQLNNLYENKYLGIIIGNDEKNILKRISKRRNFINKNFLIKDFSLNPEIYMQLCDVILIPSSREGFCQVAIEASSCEVPIIAYDVIGLKDSIINEITGYLVNYGNSKKIVNLIIKLKDNPDLRKTMGYQGRMMVIKKYKKSFVLETLINSLKKIINS